MAFSKKKSVSAMVSPALMEEFKKRKHERENRNLMPSDAPFPPVGPTRVEEITPELMDPYDLIEDPDDTPTPTHHGLHPGAIKDVEDVDQWYTEKSRISIARVQTAKDDYTLYIRDDQGIDKSLAGWALIGFLLLLIGAFL